MLHKEFISEKKNKNKICKKLYTKKKFGEKIES